MDAKLVEKVREAIGDECPEAICDYPACDQCRRAAQAAIAAVLEHLSAVTPEMVEAGVTAWAVPRDSLQETLAAAYLAMLAQVKP